MVIHTPLHLPFRVQCHLVSNRSGGCLKRSGYLSWADVGTGPSAVVDEFGSIRLDEFGSILSPPLSSPEVEALSGTT